MRAKVRHQLFLDAALSARLEALASKPGVTKSSLLADAVSQLLDRRAYTEIETEFGTRLNRLMTAVSRVERNTHILIETLALFVRYELAIHPPLAENDEAGRAQGRLRFDAFVDQVGRQLMSGRRSFDGSGDER